MKILKSKKALSSFIIALIVVVIAAAAIVTAIFIIWFFPGNLKTEQYSNTNFNNIEVGSAFQVNITEADTYSITITAGVRIFDRIQLTQQEQTLKIDMTSGILIGTSTAKADITMPTLNKLTLTGATKATTNGFTTSQPLTLEISGASSLDTTNLVAQEINTQISGASRLSAQGNATNLTANISGASNMDLTYFQINNANVTISGASHAIINLNGTLNANASGASNIEYLGDPTLGNINTSGASNVTKK